MHKLILTSVIVFFPKGFELVTGMVVIVSYICLILLTKPFARKSDDRLQLLALTELFMFMLTAYSFQSQIDLDDTTDLGLSILLIVVGSVFLLFFLVQLISIVKKLYALYKLEKENTELLEEYDDGTEESTTEAKTKQKADLVAKMQDVDVDSDDDDFDESDFDSLGSDMSLEATVQMKEAAASRQAKRDAKLAKKADSKKKKSASAHASKSPSHAFLSESDVDRMSSAPRGMELEMTSSPLSSASAAAARETEAAEAAREAEIFNTPQGKFVKVPAYDLALAKRAEAARAEEAKAARLLAESQRPNQHPLAGSIKKVPVTMAAPMLLHQQTAAAVSAAADLVTKKEPVPRVLPKK